MRRSHRKNRIAAGPTVNSCSDKARVCIRLASVEPPRHRPTPRTARRQRGLYPSDVSPDSSAHFERDYASEMHLDRSPSIAEVHRVHMSLVRLGLDAEHAVARTRISKGQVGALGGFQCHTARSIEPHKQAASQRGSAISPAHSLRTRSPLAPGFSLFLQWLIRRTVYRAARPDNRSPRSAPGGQA